MIRRASSVTPEKSEARFSAITPSGLQDVDPIDRADVDS
jgi:hypothetical protein